MIRGIFLAWMFITLLGWTLLPMLRVNTLDDNDWRIHDVIRATIMLAVLVIAYA